jgi:hypothetical protein
MDRNDVPPFSWFERLTHSVFCEYLLRQFAPGVIRARDSYAEERQRLLGIIGELPANVQDDLKKLANWTAQFTGYAVINPHAPNTDWTAQVDTVETLVRMGVINSEGQGLEGKSWLKNRLVGEVVGELAFGSKQNPLRDSDLFLPVGREEFTASEEALKESEADD